MKKVKYSELSGMQRPRGEGGRGRQEANVTGYGLRARHLKKIPGLPGGLEVARREEKANKKTI